MAAHQGLAPDQIILTNGVDEAIHLLLAARFWTRAMKR